MICNIDGCDKVAIAHGWCHSHYMRNYRRGGDPSVDRRRTTGDEPERFCEVENCGRHYYAKGMCQYHYSVKRKEAQPVGPWERNCEFCGDKFLSRYKNRATYCSRDCKDKARFASDRGRMAVRKWQFKTKFGITVQDYERMRDAQGGACALCDRTEPIGRVSQYTTDFWLHVDHDHEDGRVRGLLCDRCNRALGNVETIPNFLDRVHAYRNP